MYIPCLRLTRQLKAMHPIDPEKACPFVGETLRELRSVVGKEATVLGFVGCPYTLATYLVEVSLSVYYWSMKADAHGALVDGYGRATSASVLDSSSNPGNC